MLWRNLCKDCNVMVSPNLAGCPHCSKPHAQLYDVHADRETMVCTCCGCTCENHHPEDPCEMGCDAGKMVPKAVALAKLSEL